MSSVRRGERSVRVRKSTSVIEPIDQFVDIIIR